jgi:8-hydroxy-5-deazaflavin:NADPH oxidoreductase
MKFAIIGAGNVGAARAVTGAGHDAVVADSTDDRLQAVAAQAPVATTISNVDAVTGADVVVFAVPFGVVGDLVSGLREELADKMILDVTNPLAPDLSGLATNGISAAELIQQAAPEARVVKAFNTVFAANQSEAAVDGTQLDGFVAGDDEEAKQTVIELLTAVGYRPIDVGPLSFARYLEGMALLNIALNAHNGWAWRSGWKLVGPTS